MNEKGLNCVVTDTYNKIRNAILAKQQVIAMYKGKYREMCPHVIGWKNGREKVLKHQFGGDSNSGLSGNARKAWLGMFVDEIEILEIRNGQWHTAPNHSRPQQNVDVIDVEVDYTGIDATEAA